MPVWYVSSQINFDTNGRTDTHNLYVFVVLTNRNISLTIFVWRHSLLHFFYKWHLWWNVLSVNRLYGDSVVKCLLNIITLYVNFTTETLSPNLISILIHYYTTSVHNTFYSVHFYSLHNTSIIFILIIFRVCVCYLCKHSPLNDNMHDVM